MNQMQLRLHPDMLLLVVNEPGQASNLLSCYSPPTASGSDYFINAYYWSEMLKSTELILSFAQVLQYKTSLIKTFKILPRG